MNADTVACPSCGYFYEGRGLTPQRRRLASLLSLESHWKKVHGGDRASLMAAAKGEPCSS